MEARDDERIDTAPLTPGVPVPAEAAELGDAGGVWELAWPTMAAFALQTVVGFVDMLFVAQLGTPAVAGVGIGSQIHFVTFAIFAAITTGTVALVARASGSGNAIEADRFVQVSMVLSVLLGLALMACAPFTPQLLALFGATTEVNETGSRYLSILLLCSVPLGIGIALSSALRAAGDVWSPLAVGLLANLINIVGDYALIFGRLGAPAMGTDGSALASAIAITVGTVVYFALWFTNRLALRRHAIIRRLPMDDCRRLIRIGVPTALEHLAFNVGIFLFLRIVTGFGTEAVSAYMIGVRILAFSFVPGLGFATAASTLVGQHLGAERPRLARRSGWRATTGAIAVMSGVGLLIILLAEPIAAWFGAAGAETARLTVTFIYILGAAQPLMAVEFTIGGALRGAGDTRFPLLSLMTGLFVFRLGSALVLLRFFDPSVVQVWSCLLLDYSAKALLLLIRFHRGRWKDLQV